jgi:hypothetical protein
MSDRIQEIQARCEAATPGPWKRTGSKSQFVDSKPNEIYGTRSIVAEVWNGIDANADFITNAREDLPWLLAQLAAAQAERDDAQRNLREKVCIVERQRERIEELEKELTTSQCGERAAVRDLCECCKKYAKMVMLPTDCLNCERRGLQEAGKGSRHEETLY